MTGPHNPAQKSNDLKCGPCVLGFEVGFRMDSEVQTVQKVSERHHHLWTLTRNGVRVLTIFLMFPAFFGICPHCYHHVSTSFAHPFCSVFFFITPAFPLLSSPLLPHAHTHTHAHTPQTARNTHNTSQHIEWCSFWWLWCLFPVG